MTPKGYVQRSIGEVAAPALAARSRRVVAHGMARSTGHREKELPAHYPMLCCRRWSAVLASPHRTAVTSYE